VESLKQFMEKHGTSWAKTKKNRKKKLKKIEKNRKKEQTSTAGELD